jgi:hypothetical protein
MILLTAGMFVRHFGCLKLWRDLCASIFVARLCTSLALQWMISGIFFFGVWSPPLGDYCNDPLEWPEQPRHCQKEWICCTNSVAKGSRNPTKDPYGEAKTQHWTRFDPTGPHRGQSNGAINRRESGPCWPRRLLHPDIGQLTLNL